MRDYNEIQAENNPNYSYYGRISQRDILPTAIKNRNLGNIILLSNTSTSTVTLGNNEQVVFTITTSSVDGGRVFSIPDISIYQTSAIAANELPTGANVTASNWQIVFMGNDLEATDGNNVKTLVYVGNLANGSTDVILKTQSRVITNTNI